MLSSIFVIVVTVLAAVGHANRYQHAQFHPRRQLNETSTAGDTFVTSTVYTTQEITITSCAPTVSDCPAEESTHTIITTVTVPAYTTVCPITMSLSPYSSPAAPIPGSLSSLISAATAAATATATPSSGSAPTGSSPSGIAYPSGSGAVPSSGSGTAPLPSYTGSPANGNNPSSVNAALPVSSLASGTAPFYILPTTGVPLRTGSPSTTNAAGAPENTFNTLTYVNNSTLTYTMGAGASTTVVTTVVQFTSTETLFLTITATSTPADFDNVVGTATSNNAAGAATTESVTGAMPTDNGAGEGNSAEPTTTMFSTSTSTIFITVQTPGSAATATGVPENAGSYGTSALPETNVGSFPSSATGACVVPQTLTITAEFTVTVTAGAGSAPSNPSSSLPFETPLPSGSAPTLTGAPYGNGTFTATGYASTGYASTGFITKPSRSCTGGAKGTGSPISGYRRRRQVA